MVESFHHFQFTFLVLVVSPLQVSYPHRPAYRSRGATGFSPERKTFSWSLPRPAPFCLNGQNRVVGPLLNQSPARKKEAAMVGFDQSWLTLSSWAHLPSANCLQASKQRPSPVSKESVTIGVVPAPTRKPEAGSRSPDTRMPQPGSLTQCPQRKLLSSHSIHSWLCYRCLLGS